MVIVTLAGAVGGAVGAWIVAGGSDSSAPRRSAESEAPALSDADDSARRIAESLTVEKAARVRLEAEVALLRSELELVSQVLLDLEIAADEDVRETGIAASAEAQNVASVAHSARASTAPADAHARPWFDSATLLAAGYSESEVARLRDRWEAYEMDKLYIIDSAMREGVAGMPKTRQARAEVELRVREELGEVDYDHLLFASGQPNRIVVADLLNRSPGSAAGLEAGDVFLAYDGKRIYRPRELREAIASTPEGSQVWVEVRSVTGDEKRLLIPSGPIGIKMRQESRAPTVR